jgi:hypothetical protein
MKILFVFSILLIWCQFGCFSKGTEIDLQKEEAEARKLFESGTSFKFAMNADGITEDGGVFTSHGYKSSDEIEIATQVGVYQKESNAVKCFEKALINTKKKLMQETIFDNEKRKIGERIVGTSGGKDFLIVNLKNNICKSYYSSSLRHLLAFEKWRDKE